MKILLCLLSDQHIPNLLSVHHFKPDRLVLVQSSAMQHKDAAKHFLGGLGCGGLNFTVEGNCHVEPLEVEDNLENVRQCLQRAYGRYPAEAWVVNLSGGTKPMSIAAFEFFKAVGARLIYINFQKPNVLLGLDGHASETCTYRPGIREFLAGYGFESSKNPEDVAKAEERAKSWWNCALRIAQACPEQPLVRLGDLHDPAVKQRWDVARKKGLQLEPGLLAPEDSGLRQELAAAFSLCEAHDGLQGKLDKYGVDFLTGGWLESFLWQLLRQHADALGIWDVRLGIRPAKIGITTDSDFDVAFMHDYRLCMVECKSGSQEHDPGAEILHKVEAVVRQFRALGIRSCLATTSSNVLGKDGQLRPGIRDRAGIYQCRILPRQGIRELAESPDNTEAVRRLVLGESASR
ncbi:MAG TPA: DUF1887 family CARF protein [Gemmataceae bacterium]|nr:DUF1887 family CARF protein [Gemmataceae bacterium]